MVRPGYVSEPLVPLRGGETDPLRVVRGCLLAMIFVSVFLQQFALEFGKVTVPAWPVC